MCDYRIVAVRKGWMLIKDIEPNMPLMLSDSIVFTDFEELTKWIKENIKPLD